MIGNIYSYKYYSKIFLLKVLTKYHIHINTYMILLVQYLFRCARTNKYTAKVSH